MSLFSVIIPTCNRAALLRESLDSVFAQTFTDCEVIVVDDGSTDETAIMVAGYGGRVRYFQQHNAGPGSARNYGARQASGDYLAFLDSDDLWFPWTLQTYCNGLKQDGMPGFIASKPFNFTESSDLEHAKQTPLSISSFSDYLAAAQQSGFTIFTCSSVAIRRAEFDRVGGFANGNFNGEDSDLWLRLGDTPGFAEIQTPACCGYRRHASSAVANLEKTYTGMIHMIMNESKGVYPGGPVRAGERRNIITRHVRPASLDLVKRGAYQKAIDLYQHAMRWHVSAGRMKYLIGFWLVLLKQIATRRRS